MKQLLKKRWDKHYAKGKNKRYWHLTIDSLLMVIILSLLTINTYLSASNAGLVLGTYNNNDFIVENIPANQTNNLNDPNSATTTNKQTITNEPTAIKSTNINLQSLARYYTANGDQLGVGPLPPQVGTATKYWIFISINNFTHGLENVLISADLPDNVVLTGKSSVTIGDNLTLTDNSKQIKWQFSQLTRDNPEQIIGLAFEVQITPTIDQVGSTAKLLTNIKISALDTVTSKIITKTNTDISTYLNHDKTANSSGIIIAE